MKIAHMLNKPVEVTLSSTKHSIPWNTPQKNKVKNAASITDEAVLVSHVVGKKHKNLMKIKRLSPNVTCRFAARDFKDSFEL